MAPGFPLPPSTEPALSEVEGLRGARNDTERLNVIPRPAPGPPEARPTNPHDLRCQSPGLRPPTADHSPLTTITHGPLTARSGASKVGRAQCGGGLYHASRLAPGTGGFGRSCLDI